MDSATSETVGVLSLPTEVGYAVRQPLVVTEPTPATDLEYRKEPQSVGGVGSGGCRTESVDVEARSGERGGTGALGTRADHPVSVCSPPHDPHLSPLPPRVRKNEKSAVSTSFIIPTIEPTAPPDEQHHHGVAATTTAESSARTMHDFFSAWQKSPSMPLPRHHHHHPQHQQHELMDALSVNGGPVTIKGGPAARVIGGHHPTSDVDGGVIVSEQKTSNPLALSPIAAALTLRDGSVIAMATSTTVSPSHSRDHSPSNRKRGTGMRPVINVSADSAGQDSLNVSPREDRRDSPHGSAFEPNDGTATETTPTTYWWDCCSVGVGIGTAAAYPWTCLLRRVIHPSDSFKERFKKKFILISSFFVAPVLLVTFLVSMVDAPQDGYPGFTIGQRMNRFFLGWTACCQLAATGYLLWFREAPSWLIRCLLIFNFITFGLEMPLWSRTHPDDFLACTHLFCLGFVALVSEVCTPVVTVSLSLLAFLLRIFALIFWKWVEIPLGMESYVRGNSTAYVYYSMQVFLYAVELICFAVYLQSLCSESNKQASLAKTLSSLTYSLVRFDTDKVDVYLRFMLMLHKDGWSALQVHEKLKDEIDQKNRWVREQQLGPSDAPSQHMYENGVRVRAPVPDHGGEQVTTNGGIQSDFGTADDAIAMAAVREVTSSAAIDTTLLAALLQLNENMKVYKRHLPEYIIVQQRTAAAKAIAAAVASMKSHDSRSGDSSQDAPPFHTAHGDSPLIALSRGEEKAPASRLDLWVPVQVESDISPVHVTAQPPPPPPPPPVPPTQVCPNEAKPTGEASPTANAPQEPQPGGVSPERATQFLAPGVDDDKRRLSGSSSKRVIWEFNAARSTTSEHSSLRGDAASLDGVQPAAGDPSVVITARAPDAASTEDPQRITSRHGSLTLKPLSGTLRFRSDSSLIGVRRSSGSPAGGAANAAVDYHATKCVSICRVHFIFKESCIRSLPVDVVETLFRIIQQAATVTNGELYDDMTSTSVSVLWTEVMSGFAPRACAFAIRVMKSIKRLQSALAPTLLMCFCTIVSGEARIFGVRSSATILSNQSVTSVIGGDISGSSGNGCIKLRLLASPYLTETLVAQRKFVASLWPAYQQRLRREGMDADGVWMGTNANGVAMGMSGASSCSVGSEQTIVLTIVDNTTKMLSKAEVVCRGIGHHPQSSEFDALQTKLSMAVYELVGERSGPSLACTSIPSQSMSSLQIVCGQAVSSSGGGGGGGGAGGNIFMPLTVEEERVNECITESLHLWMNGHPREGLMLLERAKTMPGMTTKAPAVYSGSGADTLPVTVECLRYHMFSTIVR